MSDMWHRYLGASSALLCPAPPPPSGSFLLKLHECTCSHRTKYDKNAITLVFPPSTPLHKCPHMYVRMHYRAGGKFSCRKVEWGKIQQGKNLAPSKYLISQPWTGQLSHWSDQTKPNGTKKSNNIFAKAILQSKQTRIITSKQHCDRLLFASNTWDTIC